MPTTETNAADDDKLRFKLQAKTDPGRLRTVNEDAVAILDAAGLRADAAFVVADGMGGLHSGDRASSEAVRRVREVVTTQLAREADAAVVLTEALRRANDAVYALAQAGPGGASAGGPVLGTTCVAGVVRDGTLFLAHAGDSRAYLLRYNQLVRLTADHSFVQERVLAGDLTEDEARKSRFRNMITRAVGIDAAIEPELRREPLQNGDVVLVCTDGLTTMLDDAEIAALLHRGATPEMLVDAANRKGGEDNVTVLLLRVESARGIAAPNGAGATPTALPPIADAARPTTVRRPSETQRSAENTNPMPSPSPTPSSSNFSNARRRTNPFVGLLAGLGLLAIVFGIATAFVPSVRQSVVARLGGGGKGAGRVANPDSAEVPDLSRATYAKPEKFVTRLTRGDLLAYSPRGYLFFAGDASGKVVAVTRGGEYVSDSALATLAIAPPLAAPIPKSRAFVTADVQGNVYLSYTQQRQIEKRSPQGQLLATITGLERPEAIAVDEDGNIYVVDFNEIKIIRARVPGLTPGVPAASGGGG